MMAIPLRKSFAVGIGYSSHPPRCDGSVEDNQEKAVCKCGFVEIKADLPRPKWVDLHAIIRTIAVASIPFVKTTLNLLISLACLATTSAFAQGYSPAEAVK